MAVFHMSSDGYFVRTWPASSSADVYVHDYTGDIYDPDLIRYKDSGRWRGGRIKIGPSGDAQFRALEVHGVVIEGNRLTQLWNDLTLTSSARSSVSWLIGTDSVSSTSTARRSCGCGSTITSGGPSTASNLQSARRRSGTRVT
ncbi:unnamed protein product [Linum tenue]|uniref:Uncharacterized protein n=1 Tax=Linum tenue TaxID=586396 RepID=A0AAV0JGG0_9ROSI|nr:unnamed protein product [Linum tenue]